MTERRDHETEMESPAPIPRWRELVLLTMAYAILGVGYWAVWQSYLPTWREMLPGHDTRLFIYPAITFFAWVVLSFALRARRCRETLLLPILALLIGLGQLFLLRLAGGATMQGLDIGPQLYKDFTRQFANFLLGWALLMGIVLFWRDYRSLARYKYVVAATAVVLLLATTLFGHATHGQTLALDLKFIKFQPHDMVKLLLVIFMAAYLVEKSELISFAKGRFGMLTRMDFRYLGPLIALWAFVMVIIFKHDDLGAALLLFGVLLGMLYLGTGRKRYIAFGLGLSLLGMVAGYQVAKAANLGFVKRLDTRISIWLDPWKDQQGKGYQICQSLMAMGAGRVVGAGLAGGYPERIPAIETDMIYAGLSEDLGLVGAVCIVGLFLALIGRLFSIGARSPDPFGRLLAAGLATSLAIQTFVILAGSTKLIPLTGITLPFISYGGTSLIVNIILIGLALKVAEEPHPARQIVSTE